MTYLFDTNAISDLVEQRSEVRSRVAAMSPADRAITCTVVVGEVRFGVERLPAGARRADLARRTAGVLATFPCEPIHPAVADPYARI